MTFNENNLVFFLGDGRRVRFWEDRWCGDDALSVSFPSLYVLVASKEAWVAEVWDSSREKGGWNPRFSGRFMIERWRVSFSPYKGREWLLIWRIGCGGKRLRMGTFLLNPFIYGG